VSRSIIIKMFRGHIGLSSGPVVMAEKAVTFET